MRRPDHRAGFGQQRLRGAEVVVLVVVEPVVCGALEQRFGHPGDVGFEVVFFDQLATAIGRACASCTRGTRASLTIVFRHQPFVVVEVPGGAAAGGLFDPLAVGVVGVLAPAAVVLADPD